jgi:hypothetical protein
MKSMMKSKMPIDDDMGMMKKPRFGARAMRPGGMKKGGMAHSDAAMDKKLIRKEISRAEKMEDEGMKKGGMVKKYAKGGGIEMKGKTKGKII